MIMLFEKNGCSICGLAKRRLRKWGLEFTERNIDEDFEAQADYFFYSDGKIETPLIVIDGSAYSRKEAYKILMPPKRKTKKEIKKEAKEEIEEKAKEGVVVAG